MPAEPDQSIERQLRRYAESRRSQAGEPFSVPPSTRQAVQAEARRRLESGASRAATRPGWLRVFWPYVALGASAVAAVGVSLIVWFQDYRRPQPMAETSVAAPPVKETAQAPPLAEPNGRAVPATRDSAITLAPSQPVAAGAPAPAAPAPVATGSTATPAADRSAALAFKAKAPFQEAALAEKPARSGEVSYGLAGPAQQAASPRQRFVRAPGNRELRRNFNSPPRPAVLNDFQVEQTDSRLRITDADGSVYEGSIQPAPALDTGARGLPQPSSQSAPEGSAARPTIGAELGKVRAAGGFRATAPGQERSQYANYSNIDANQVQFRAVGTNRSLNQKVVFDGRLLVTNVETPAPQNQQLQMRFLSNNLPQLFLNNSVVQGRATVGGRTQLEINAVPANP